MNSDTKQMYDSATDNLLENIKLAYAKWSSWEQGINEFNDSIHVKSGRKFDKVIAGSSVWGCNQSGWLECSSKTRERFYLFF